MTITEEGALLPLTAVYTTTTSTVLICEVADELKESITHWMVYLNDIMYQLSINADNNVGIPHLYCRLYNLDRETEYTAYVKAVDDQGTESVKSNVVTFTTGPKF